MTDLEETWKRFCALNNQLTSLPLAINQQTNAEAHLELVCEFCLEKTQQRRIFNSRETVSKHHRKFHNYYRRQKRTRPDEMSPKKIQKTGNEQKSPFTAKATNNYFNQLKIMMVGVFNPRSLLSMARKCEVRIIFNSCLLLNVECILSNQRITCRLF